MQTEKQGEMIIFFEALLWGLFPVITVISLQSVNPLIALGWSDFFAALLFASILTWKKKWPEIRNKEAIKDILITALILGVAYYLFFFFGLRYTSAGNASIIALTEIFFSYLFFHVWRKDYMPPAHIFGAVLMVVGAIIVLYPNLSGFRPGDALIMSAALIAPLGNFFQKRARQRVGSESILFVRCLISAPVVFLCAYFTNADFGLGNIDRTLIFLAINGIFLLGLSKILWIERIHRLNVTKAISLSSVSPLFTLIFAWLLLYDKPTGYQLLSFIPMFFGIMLLSKKAAPLPARSADAPA